MHRAVEDLADFSDERLFKEVSNGISLIVKNAISLDDTAQYLHQGEQFHVSDIVRGFAEEEAAKVLILIDLVRCPLNRNKKVKIAKRFYNHLYKRIYAMVCSLPGFSSFEELSELIEIECRPYHLDGPNSVDWIFRNSIIANRERALYVDFVRDITEMSGDNFWIEPYQPQFNATNYESSDCVKLSYALSKAGVSSPEGLAVIADVWRSFMPVPETERGELKYLIELTLEKLANLGTDTEIELVSKFIVLHWTYPLWSLELEGRARLSEDLEGLRAERMEFIGWIESTNAKRDPPPAISRPKVEALSDAYMAWRKEAEELDADSNESMEGRLRIHSYSEWAECDELSSCRRIKKMFRALTEEERAALLALGWYGNERGVADWPRIYQRAIDWVATTYESYQIHYGHRWLNGLNRWDSSPKPFTPGQRF